MDNAIRASTNQRKVLKGEGGKQTLRVLGAACGKRLVVALEALEQNRDHLVMRLGTSVLARLGDAFNDQCRVHEKLLALWQRSNPTAVFLPLNFHSEIQMNYWRLWSRRFSAREMRRLDRVLALFSRRERRVAGEALQTKELDDALEPFLEVLLGKVRSRDVAEAERLHALTNGASRWFRWRRRKADTVKAHPEKVVALQRSQHAARWRRAMHLVADVLLVRILTEYDIPKPQDICYFVSGLLDAGTPLPPR